MAYVIAAAAQKELEEYRRQLIADVGAHLITIDQAFALQWNKLKKILAEGRIEVPGECETFPIACNGCGKVHVVAGDVKEYKCHCSPNVTRFTFQSRKIDLSILGVSHLEELISANKGRKVVGTIEL